jgi:hypothetical protein
MMIVSLAISNPKVIVASLTAHHILLICESLVARYECPLVDGEALI